MQRKRISMPKEKVSSEPLSREVGDFCIGEFFNLHQQFMTVKKLEGLAPKTLDDHEKFMRYFENWLISNVKVYQDRVVEKGIFLEYVAYMCTVWSSSPAP